MSSKFDEKMIQPLNVILMIIDGHGQFTGNLDWGTKEFLGLKDRMDHLQLRQQGFIEFSNTMSPAASTIMSIESILSGLYAAKTHKMHWREWPSWDRFEHPVLTSFLRERGYEVNGFSYLLNSENWLPSIYCYRPDLYAHYPSIKRDTHSHEAVLAALRHYFEHSYSGGHQHVFVVHTIFLFDIWNEVMHLFQSRGFDESNTIIAVTSDHYFPYGFGRQWLLGERDNSLILHHTDLTEHNTRVFFYLKYPGCTAATISAPIAGYDIAPTILDVMGMADEWPGTFDGDSLLPIIKGTAPTDRMLRNDNVYPYQIGEKQGRITAIKRGNFKYVYRPDPPSSYIAYRLTEGWSLVLQKEELYDISKDPLEKENLLLNLSESTTKELDSLRDFYLKSQSEILSSHIASLCKVFNASKIKEQMFGGKDEGELLCFQTSPDEVFITLISVIRNQLPLWRIDVVSRSKQVLKELELLGMRDRVCYPDDVPFESPRLRDLAPWIFSKQYDCVLNTSNVPLGGYRAVYDNAGFPVGDFDAVSKVMSEGCAGKKVSLCLDLTWSRIGATRATPLKSQMKAYVRGVGVRIVQAIRPKVKRLLEAANVPTGKISSNVSERIIRNQPESYKKEFGGNES